MAETEQARLIQQIVSLEHEVTTLRQQLAQQQPSAPPQTRGAAPTFSEELMATAKTFVGFDDTTTARLTALQPFMVQEVDAIVEAFYTHVQRFAPLRPWLADPAVLTRLRAAQTAYLLDLTSGSYDHTYFQQRWRIGEVHNRLQLTPQWYLGAYSVFIDLILVRLRQHPAALQSVDLPDLLNAIYKAFSLDMQLAIQAYIQGYQAQLRQANADLQHYSHALETRVTERTEELLQAGKLAALGELAAGIAHEINNPLNGIMNYADIIAEELPATHKLGVYARDIVQETQRIAGIVRELLTFARQESHEHSLANVADILDASLKLTAALLEKHGIILERAYTRALPPIKCRMQRLQQVVLNLLSNAHYALNARYPSYDANKMLRISTTLHQQDQQAYIRFSIRDHGIGIAPALQARIFEPFFTTRRDQGGTGLGLSVSYGIIRDHQGTIRVDSVVGSYTQFDVDLPVAEEAHAEENR